MLHQVWYLTEYLFITSTQYTTNIEPSVIDSQRHVMYVYCVPM